MIRSRAAACQTGFSALQEYAAAQIDRQRRRLIQAKLDVIEAHLKATDAKLDANPPDTGCVLAQIARFAEDRPQEERDGEPD
jgi:hypothetical protein